MAVTAGGLPRQDSDKLADRAWCAGEILEVSGRVGYGLASCRLDGGWSALTLTKGLFASINLAGIK